MILMLWSPQNHAAQTEIGYVAGFQIPGKQDLKFKKYDEFGKITDIIKTSEVCSKSSIISMLFIKHWKEKFGLSLEYLSWEHESHATEFVSDIVPDFQSTEHAREAIVLILPYRKGFPFKSQK
jgi:hypothetical protein